MQDSLVKIISNPDTTIVDSSIVVANLASGEINTLWYGVGIVVFIVVFAGILAWRDHVSSKRRKENK